MANFKMQILSDGALVEDLDLDRFELDTWYPHELLAYLRNEPGFSHFDNAIPSIRLYGIFGFKCTLPMTFEEMCELMPKLVGLAITTKV